MTTLIYHPLQRYLHWFMALLVPGLFGLGLWMRELDYYSPWYKAAPDWHKSIGILLAVLLLIRLATKCCFAAPVVKGPAVTRWLAKAAHWLMYALLIGLVCSGYLISTEDGRAIEVFGLFAVPALGALFDQQADISGEIHLLLAWSLIGLVVVHLLAALKHHFIDKDQTLNRMLGRTTDKEL